MTQKRYADEELWINDYEYEIFSEAKEMALPVETDVPDEKLTTYADKELYVVIGYDDVCGNGNYEAILYGVYSTEQLAREAAEELLELGNIHHYEIEYPKLDEFGWRQVNVDNSFINQIKELNCNDTRVNYKDCNGKFLGERLLFEEIPKLLWFENLCFFAEREKIIIIFQERTAEHINVTG